ncbi:hypothetical protein [Pinirhizobacter soli]|uniref:hypothetical protein n=1 Tax=Pinirhizobacter soli TaxID=2786953 RepID=UPI00202AA4F7|nr:hypothetical protein [Pinirhizobacter soli]
MKQMRWREGLSHRGADVNTFFSSLLEQPGRSVLYIAGAGFDPRASHLALLVSQTAAKRKAILIREDRPEPAQVLVDRAEANEEELRHAFPDHEVIHIEVFDEDHAVVGGHRIVTEIRKRVLDENGLGGVTDVIVDMSAISIGISFPVVGLLYKMLTDKPQPNLHVVAATGGPEVETAIVAEHAENYQNPWGFKGKGSPGDSPVRLWIPQLANPKKRAFTILFEELDPTETCPVFPFPARNPRSVEILLDQFGRELSDTWRIDTRQMLFAAEDDPLDLYRTLSRIHTSRAEVYRRASQPAETVLSPIGSKALAIGALLAALEHELPVAYVEARRFEPPSGGFKDVVDEARFVHVWVLGEVYADATLCPASEPPSCTAPTT